LNIPAVVAANCRKTPERAAWLDGLPRTLAAVGHAKQPLQVLFVH